MDAALGVRHARATTTFFGDNWQNMQTQAKVTEVRDGWSCFNPAKDIVVPPVGPRTPNDRSKASSGPILEPESEL